MRQIPFVGAVLLSLCLCAITSAQLTINVDASAQEYYLSGSATGAVGGDEDMGYEVFWNNSQPYNGGFSNFLSDGAFTVSGNTAGGFTMFIHGNGNINGVFNFVTAGSVTLTGNSAVRFDYGSWDPLMIAEIESKAALGETVAVTRGSSDFALVFSTAAIPEPSTYAALFGGLAFLGTVVFRFCGKKTLTD
jgi:hypothetical protein